MVNGDLCDNMEAKFNELGLGTGQFRWTVAQGQTDWEDWNDNYDSFCPEQADLFFAYTHGNVLVPYQVDGHPNAEARWARFTIDGWNYSGSMRLGDEGRGLSILATFSCETMKYQDGYIWDRWYPIFAGGLRLAFGSSGTIFPNGLDAQFGAVFGEHISYGWPLWEAWHYAMDWGRGDPSEWATGWDETDCWYRLGSMDWNNFDDEDYFVRLSSLDRKFDDVCGRPVAHQGTPPHVSAPIKLNVIVLAESGT